MESYRKKDILEITATLKEANDFVTVTVPTEPGTLDEVLMQCQKAALQIGTYLEKSGGKYAPMIGILENYCENIYQIIVNTQDRVLCRKLTESIQKQLEDLQERIKHEIPEDKKEIVFLPYKASMWDSLESVWKAAQADMNIDTYVIPIPYYDRNPDGSFHKEYYEGDLYPEYVPITRYDEYDFEGRKPDVIFIHNAYDNANYVTSVHPYFYSENLKKFTSKLVYIPYFILQEIKPEDKFAVDNIRHFCILPGIFNADKVIVQSEDMRQVYINVLVEEVLKQHSTLKERDIRKFWNNKILGSGSPKLDRLLQTKKENLKIPSEWLKIIRKPDGTQKKIIFYNTSVSALLQYNETMLKKMKDVFLVFLENKDEVALLWRPHPLVESTLRSMRPQLWDAYMKIREKYILEGWGIYDNTADLDRAIILSDAYYGDGSSVVQLYQKTGKPIMLQDPYYLNKENTELVMLSYTADIMEGNLILISEFANAIFLVSLSTGIVTTTIRIDGEEDIDCLTLSFIKRGETLLVVPYCAKDFHVIDLYSREQYILNDVLTNEERNINNKFITTICFGNKAWIIGEEIPKIIEFNLENMMVIRTTAFKDIDNIGLKTDGIRWCTGYVIQEESIILPSRNSGVVMSIDANSGKIQGALLPGPSGFSSVHLYHGDIILCDFEGSEYVYDVEKQRIKKISGSGQKPYFKCIVSDDKRIYFGNDGSLYCRDENKLINFEYNARQDTQHTGLRFQFIIVKGNHVYFQERYTGCIFSMNILTLVCKQLEITPLKNLAVYKKKYLDNLLEKSAVEWIEEGFITLNDFILNS